MSTTVSPPAAPATVRPTPKLDVRALAVPVGIFAASRVFVFATFQIALWVNPYLSWDRLLSEQWDAGWFMKVVREGYPKSVPPGGIPASQTTLSFFPGYPAVIRVLHALTRLPEAWIGVAVAMIGALIGVVFLWLLTERLFDRRTANRAAALLAFAPEAFILSLTYSEGMFFAGGIACVYFLHRRWWLAAGLAGAVASATRPPGVMLAVACGVVALIEIYKSRNWRALIAPAIAPLGAVVYFIYLHFHTGSIHNYFLTEELGWGEKFDFGHTLFHRFVDLMDEPWRHPYFAFNYLMIALAIVGTILLLRQRVPLILPMLLVLLILPTTLGTSMLSSARFVFAAFPLYIALARALRGVAFGFAFLLSAGLLVGLTIGSASHVFVP